MSPTFFLQAVNWRRALMWRFFEVALTHSRCSCNSFRSKPVCATCNDVDDDPYFSSYAHFGIHEEMLKVWKLISFIADFAQRLLRRLDTVFSYGFRYLLSGMAVLAFWFVNNLRVYQEIHAICSLFFWPVIHKTWLQHLFLTTLESVRVDLTSKNLQSSGGGWVRVDV